MRKLSIDIESYSSVPLKDCGVYRYVESDDFEILLLAYAYDDDPVTVVDLTKDPFPDNVAKDIIHNPDVEKFSYNAVFEMTCFAKYFDTVLDPHEWQDTMIWAVQLGLPRSLGDVGAALRLPEDAQKMKEGKALIRYFCVPCNPTKSNGGRTRNLPEHAPEKWATFIEYNRRDVETERTIRKRIEGFRPSEEEHEAWCLDFEINRRGVLCDRKLADAAIYINSEHTTSLMAEMRQLTGLENPNSLTQLKEWFGTTDPLDKKAVAKMLPEETGARKRVLEIRQELGKSSVKKYQAMQNYMCRDDRCRGLFQFYGASRTGRWAGKGVQLQNLPQNHIEDLDVARSIARTGDHDGLEMMFGNVPDTLSQLIRTAFIPRPGYAFAVADFSAIEARILSYVSDEKWRLQTFAEGGDIYCASASQMFHVPVKKHGVNGHLRQKGKIAELALG